jgi:SAM-dependent methyltransferase
MSTVSGVTFVVDADAYDRFMGRYSAPLAPQLADFAGVGPGQRALDVGCGTGALTAELVERLGASAVAAADPSEPFAEAVRRRHPGVGVEVAPAEALPYGDWAFDVTLAQLVVPFMADPAAGLAEMGRVTRAGGTVAASVWDHGGGRSPLTVFWRAVHELDPSARDERRQPGSHAGQLAEMLGAAGLSDVEAGEVHVTCEFASFDDWWEPFTLGVGPAGAHVAKLDATATDSIRARCRDALGDGSFTVTATAWAARGRA